MTASTPSEIVYANGSKMAILRQYPYLYAAPPRRVMATAEKLMTLLGPDHVSSPPAPIFMQLAWAMEHQGYDLVHTKKLKL